MILALALAAALNAPLMLPAHAADFAVALFPPEDVATTVSLVKAVGKELTVPVDELSADEFVDPAQANPQRYPMAAYSGFERYVYTVKRPGDGAQALLSYVRSGGVLLVAGQTWPFYRAVDYVGGQYVVTRGEPPEFEGPEDAWLKQQMEALEQTATGNFNRFLGLNISGEGTTQFEEPDEAIIFTTTPQGQELFPSLPDSFPFPGTGDLRFRPASGENLQEGVEFTPVVIAEGASGKVYGSGICTLRHESGGTVIYVWGTLLGTALGRDLVRDAILLAARLTATPEELQQAEAIAEQLGALEQRAADLSAALDGRPADDALASYLQREVDFAAGRTASVRGMAMVRQTDAAREATTAIDEALSRVARRLGES